MTLKIIYFILMILVPYSAEQYSYWQSVTKAIQPAAENAKTVTQGYGWRVIWDASFFFVLISAGIRIIFVQRPWSSWEWLGYLFFLAGIMLRIFAIRILGKFYDPGIVLKADHRMIQNGPYRILRHPLHLGTVLQITGLAFFAPLWLALPAGSASLVLCLSLNRTEDCTHAQQLGDEFKVYYLKTWDLVDLIFWKTK
jgi:protein-S-isoprenylcysteine O-methyltransferase Ste14